MATPSHLDIAHRLLANVEANRPDQTDAPMKVPAASYRDPQRWQQEIERIFLKVPLVVALSCDIAHPGDYVTLEICGRPILVVRGDDGQVRTFLNICRHRGARVAGEACGHSRRFTCPYHSWTYDNAGALVGVPGRESFGELDVTGLVPLPTEEKVGVVLAVLDREGELDADDWLGGMADALASLKLTELHPYRVLTELEGPNWKIAADGYVDGYHIGYLHKNSIGSASITNRNTYDAFGPHQRIGFAKKSTEALRGLPEQDWSLPDAISLVHFLFPNVSLSGGHGDALQLSRLFPGPTPDRSRTAQHQYFREPLEGEEMLAKAEERRRLYERVVRDEDYATGLGITRGLAGMGDDHFRFGRNEVGNQRLHRTIDAFVNAKPELATAASTAGRVAAR